MKEKETIGDALLDCFKALCGCSYLSDLPILAKEHRLKKVAEQILAGAFSAADWAEALRYLTGAAGMEEDNAAALRNQLIELL